MSVQEGSIQEDNAVLREQSRKWQQTLIIVGLLTPAMFIMTSVLVIGFAILFTYSFYSFTGGTIQKSLSLDSYARFFLDPYYRQVFGEGFRLGSVATLICMVVGYPLAYAMSRLRNAKLLALAFLIIFSPLLTSVIARSYGWLLLLARTGIVNYGLLKLGIINEPIQMLYNFFGVVVALVHVLLPYSVFPIVSVLVQIDPSLKEAASDLGANRLQVFREIVFPISLPGLFSSFQLTLVLSLTAYVTPRLLGGGRVMVPSIMIFESINSVNWPLTAVMSAILLTIVLVIIYASNQIFKKAYSRLEA